MITNTRPKRALIAYCALAEKLNTPGVGYMQALTPFLAEAAIPFQGKFFDAQEFSNAVNDLYGIRIPRLAVLGMAAQLEKDGLLESDAKSASQIIYRYKKISSLNLQITSSISEIEIVKILNKFATIARADDRLKSFEDEYLHDSFLDRLLNIDSMRILSRRDLGNAMKKNPSTIVANKENQISDEDRIELHLDYVVSQFLIDLMEKDKDEFELVSNIAFANMAAEAIACFKEPSEGGVKELKLLTVYLDSPLLLDILGINSEYSEYGKDLLRLIELSGVRAATFDDCINEAENTIKARLHSSAMGINKNAAAFGNGGVSNQLLSAISGRFAEQVTSKNINVDPNPTNELHKKFRDSVGNIDDLISRGMQTWRNEDAKLHDQRSIWSLLRLRNSSTPCTHICDSEFIFITRNTPLTSIANAAWRLWLEGATSHSRNLIERWSPIAMSDKQFAGYLWARTGGGDGNLSRVRLLAHCSSAVRPRADIKARTYNLVLESYGKDEADIFEALLNDREGVQALMRATNGDPEDATPARLPAIFEAMKLAAGEFAAKAEREKSQQKEQEIQIAHEQELSKFHEKNDFLTKESEQTLRELEKVKLQQLELQSKQEQQREYILRQIFASASFVYKSSRWFIAILFGCIVWFIGYMSALNPAIITPQIVSILAAVTAFVSFWFIPELLNTPLQKLAEWQLKRELKKFGLTDDCSKEHPNFKEMKWGSVVIEEKSMKMGEDI
jgi:type IV secretory pathway TrbD component